MRAVVSVSVASLLLASACGASDQDPVPTGPDAGQGTEADAGGGVAGLYTPTLFVFDQGLKRIVRLADENGDGDMLDAGESTVFFDNTGELGIYNSQGMWALGDSELLATDNVAGNNNDDSNVIRLTDENGDGDAFDAGEAAMWFAGGLPGEATMTFPVALAQGPDGAFYLVNNDFSDGLPDGVYRLSDENGDGDVDDAGESSLHYDFGQRDPVSQVFDIDFAPDGRAYTIDIRTPEENNASVDAIESGGSNMGEVMDAAILFGMTQNDEKLVLPGFGGEITYDSVNDRVILATIDIQHHDHLVALTDFNDSGSFDTPAELTILWDAEIADADGQAGVRDMHWMGDGTILLTDGGSGRIFRLVDENADGDYNDIGETRMIFDAEVAASVGQPEIGNLFTTAVWTGADTPD